MGAGRVVARLIVASLFSGGSAGALLFTITMTIDEIRTADSVADLDLAGTVMLAPAAGLVGAVVASLPAFLVGSALWSARRYGPEARHWSAWAVAGLCVGGLMANLPPLGVQRETYFIPALVSGAAAALVFYGFMCASAPVRSYSEEGV